MAYNDDNDFFDGPDIPDEEVEKPVEQPKRSPDDPDYWEQPESEFEHLRPSTPGRRWLWVLVGAAVLVAIFLTVWLRWFSSYSDGAMQYGYVEQIERRGTIFKTFEGTILPYRELMDTTRVYKQDFVFSTPDPHLAALLKRYMLQHRPVRVEYSTYHATLPWRGERTIVITAVDTVNPAAILPPEYTPAIHRP